MERFYGCLFGALAALLLARGAGLPLWVDRPADLTLTDASDVAVLTFLALWCLSGWLRKEVRDAITQPSRSEP